MRFLLHSVSFIFIDHITPSDFNEGAAGKTGGLHEKKLA